MIARHADTLEGERVADDLPGLSFLTDAIGHRHPDIREIDFVEVAELDHARIARHRNARRIHRYEQDGKILSGRAGTDEQKAPVRAAGIGCPDLGAVDHVMVAVWLRARAQRRQVGPGVRLGKALTPDHLAARDPFDVQVLLLGRTVFHERRTDPVDVHVLGAARLAGSLHFLAQDEMRPVRTFGPAVFLRPMRHQQPALGQPRAELAREFHLQVGCVALRNVAFVPILGQQFVKRRANTPTIVLLLRCPTKFHMPLPPDPGYYAVFAAGSRGRPSPRSAMMLRWISELPPEMVQARE